MGATQCAGVPKYPAHEEKMAKLRLEEAKHAEEAARLARLAARSAAQKGHDAYAGWMPGILWSPR